MIALLWERTLGASLLVTDAHLTPFPFPAHRGLLHMLLTPPQQPLCTRPAHVWRNSCQGLAPSSPLLQHPRQAEASHQWQMAGTGLLGNPALSPVLSYSKKHLYKGVPRRVTQALVSPSETQLKKCWGQLPWGTVS